eukprot:Skav230427  [mRNA]  locus=scaffold1601:38128:39402:- [translate_table: standard]
MPEKDILQHYRRNIEKELFQNVLPFWNRHSEDVERGGFFACLDEAGEVYDRRKFMWLNGRQIYMYATLAGTYTSDELSSLSNSKLSREKLLRDAEVAANFMYKHGVRDDDGRVFFSLTEDGQPYHMERKIFSACFLCLGIGSVGAVFKADGEAERAQKLIDQCVFLLKRIVAWSRDPSLLGRETYTGAPVTSPMNVPMIILNLLEELQTKRALPTDSDVIDVKMEEEWCVAEILKHVNMERKQVLEVVLSDGSICPGYDGRHMNPGHAIEAGWFVLQYAKRTGRTELVQVAEQMITWSFEEGWDKEHGGLFYFLDSEGRSPVYLEWDMKLWWPHNEAMIAFAMLYETLGKEEHWDSFVKVTDYAIGHFSDPKNGEWYGYLNREGKVTHRFKGGPYKGCFHVPRSLFMVYQILSRCSAKDVGVSE